MKTDTTKIPMQKILSLLILVVGLALMIMKIYADSEPGAIPLALVLVGAIWYSFARWPKA